MDYYCKCKYCKYINPNERKSYKWYCEYYGCYEDPDVLRECKKFKEQ